MHGEHNLIDLFACMPKGGKSSILPLKNFTNPKDVIYAMRAIMFSGLLEGKFTSSRLAGFFFRGRPLFLIYQSADKFEFGFSALELARIDLQAQKTFLTTSPIDQEIIKCFSGFLSNYPIFRNFNPKMLVLDELFTRMVQEKFTGCMFISTVDDHVVLLIHDGKILSWEDGKILNRYPIDESPVTKDMAKAVNIMADPRTSIDIYETPENLYYDLSSMEYGVFFKNLKSIFVLKETLKKIASDELKAKSVDFDRAFEEVPDDIFQIEDFVHELESRLTIELSKKILQPLIDHLLDEIEDFKK